MENELFIFLFFSFLLRAKSEIYDHEDEVEKTKLEVMY